MAAPDDAQDNKIDELEKKWTNWSEDIEENKRLVIDDVAEAVPSPFRAATTRSRVHRSARENRVVSACPIFYGWVVASLVTLAAFIVSPVQVYCVGVVLDAMQVELELSRVRISTIYAAALLFAAPVMLLHMRALAFISRKLLVAGSGLLFCFACALLAYCSGQISLLLVWTLLQLVGPGTLYPATELALLQWWSARRGRVQAIVQSAGSLLAMLVLPAILSVAACADGECWQTAYISLGMGLLLPACILAVLLVDGGAADHDLLLDAQPHLASTPATEPADKLDLPQPTATTEERWSLHDALTHTSFWLAQVSFSTVHAVVNAYIFHRTDLMRDVGLPPEQSLTLQMLVALSCTFCTPAGLLVRRKENLLLVALLLTACALLLLVHNHNPGALYASSVLMGCAFGVTNGYATVLWEYFYGHADAERIKQTSIAITSATSGSAIWAFAYARQEAGSYRGAMNAAAIVAFVLATLDLLALTKPELLEAIVRRAPTWEQLLARRQREGYFSLTGQLLDCLYRVVECVFSVPTKIYRRNQANPIDSAIA